MRKHKVIKSAILLLLILILGLSGCGGSSDSGNSGSNEDVITWSFYSPYGPEDSACCEIWPALFAQIEEETGGRLSIKTYWSGQHPYEGSDMLKVVSDGTAQLAHFYGGYVSSVDPIFALDALPLLFPYDAMQAWDINSELWGGFEQNTDGILEKILQEDWNASMIHMVPATSQRLMTMGYSADKVGDLAGHKIRVYSAEFGKFVQALGGTPVSITLSEVYTGLSTNLIDGLITSVVVADSGGYFDFIDTVTKWEVSQTSDGLMVNQEALNSLPEDVKEIFLRVMHDSATKPETLEIDQNNDLVAEMEQQGEIQVLTPTNEERDSVKEIMKRDVWEPWAESAGENGAIALEFVESKQ